MGPRSMHQARRQDLAGGPVVAVPELESEQVVSILGQVAEQVELLIERPAAWQVTRSRMRVVEDEHGEHPGDGMAGEPGADELPVGWPMVGGVAGGVHADEAEADPGGPCRSMTERCSPDQSVSPIVKSISSRARSRSETASSVTCSTWRKLSPCRRAICAAVVAADGRLWCAPARLAVPAASRYGETSVANTNSLTTASPQSR